MLCQLAQHASDPTPEVSSCLPEAKCCERLMNYASLVLWRGSKVCARRLFLHHLRTSGSSEVDGCRPLFSASPILSLWWQYTPCLVLWTLVTAHSLDPFLFDNPCSNFFFSRGMQWHGAKSNPNQSELRSICGSRPQLCRRPMTVLPSLGYAPKYESHLGPHPAHRLLMNTPGCSYPLSGCVHVRRSTISLSYASRPAFTRSSPASGAWAGSS